MLCLWLPWLSVERLRRAGGAAGDRPAALARDARGRRVVAAACPRAMAAGIGPGRALADALALAPGLRVAEADPAADRAALDRLADWCGRYTPAVAPDPEGGAAADGMGGDGGLLLDIAGCAHLFGGEAALLDDALNRLAGLGWTARAALADTAGAAWALARFGDGRARIVPSGGQRAAIAPLPLAALRLPPAAAEGLERVGLRRVADLFDTPRAPLAARFGPVPARRLAQALGEEPEPLSPRAPAVPRRVRLSLPEPVATAEDIARLARRLLGRLVERLAREDLGARRLRLVFYRTDGETRRLSIGTVRASRDADALLRLFAEHFDRVDPGFGIDAAALEAVAVEPFRGEQAGLGAAPAARALDGLADLLASRLGPGAVARPAPRESHAPERAETRLPAGAEGEGGAAPWPADAPGPGAPRPARLLRRPEPVEAVALLPDRPPVRFRWRGVEYRVVRAAGPERIAPEWWRAGAPPATRDYFRVEDSEGRRYWLFREGLSERGEAPAWRLHGLFA